MKRTILFQWFATRTPDTHIFSARGMYVTTVARPAIDYPAIRYLFTYLCSKAPSERMCVQKRTEKTMHENGRYSSDGRNTCALCTTRSAHRTKRSECERRCATETPLLRQAIHACTVYNRGGHVFMAHADVDLLFSKPWAKQEYVGKWYQFTISY